MDASISYSLHLSKLEPTRVPSIAKDELYRQKDSKDANSVNIGEKVDNM